MSQPDLPTSGTDEMRAANHSWWEERAGLHAAVADGYYGERRDAVVAGTSSLRPLEVGLAGDVTGQRVLHVQCHIGLDTLSWAYAGAAEVVGADFSAAALDGARALADAAGVADRVRFVEADSTSLPAELHGRFDLAVASYGVLGWIADLDAWMRSVAACLAPGGRLVVAELHPIYNVWESLEPLRSDFPYADAGPQRFESSGSYAAPAAITSANVTIEHAHGLGEVVTAAVGAGLLVEALTEEMDSDSDFGRGIIGAPDDDGRYRLRVGGAQLPMVFGLRARKPQ